MHEFWVWTFGCCLPILSSYHIIFCLRRGSFWRASYDSNVPAKIAIFFVTFLGRQIKLSYIPPLKDQYVWRKLEQFPGVPPIHRSTKALPESSMPVFFCEQGQWIHSSATTQMLQEMIWNSLHQSHFMDDPVGKNNNPSAETARSNWQFNVWPWR